MFLQEPQIQIVPIVMSAINTTSMCDDGVTDGGTYCIDSVTTTDCGTPMQATNIPGDD